MLTETLITAASTFIREHAREITWIIGLYVAGRFALRVIVRRIVAAADDGDEGRVSGKEKRARTLADLLSTLGNVVITTVILVMTLRLFGMDPTPIIAGAGVIGFGVGFGMQTLVKDFIAGMFIFAENQFAVGDRVKIGTFEGTVHRMSIRSTTLCDAEGNLVFLSNGSVSNVTNYTFGEQAKAKRDVSAHGVHEE